MLADEALNEEVSEFVRGKIRATVEDPETARKLMPSYFIGTKRMILDNDYFETYNRPNVSLVDLREDPIETFTADGVRPSRRRASDRHAGARHGFRRGQRLHARAEPEGPRRLRLEEKWAERFDNYFGTAIAGFPNLFMIHGPGAPGVFFTMPLGGERTVDWIADCITHLRATQQGAIEATEDAEASWDTEINAIAERTLYPRTNSWYMGANIPGKPRQFLGHLRGSQYFDRLAEIADQDYAGFRYEARRRG